MAKERMNLIVIHQNCRFSWILHLSWWTKKWFIFWSQFESIVWWTFIETVSLEFAHGIPLIKYPSIHDHKMNPIITFGVQVSLDSLSSSLRPQTQELFINFALHEELSRLQIPLAWIPPDFVVRESFHMRPIARDLSHATIFVDIHRNETRCDAFQRPFATSVPRVQRVPVFNSDSEPNESEATVVIGPSVRSSNCVLEDYDSDSPTKTYTTFAMTDFHILNDFTFFPTNGIHLCRFDTSFPISPDFWTVRFVFYLNDNVLFEICESQPAWSIERSAILH
jgi:hypothetical protein